MDCETKMITNGHPKAKEPNVVASFSELAHDVVELGELQAQLLKLDVTVAWQRMRTGLVLAVVGACLLLGSIPVVLLVISEALAEFAGWSRTASLGLAALIGAGAAAAMAALAWRWLKTTFATFERSREEFSRNLAWIKSSLKQQPARPRQRSEVAIPH
jgi:hypothetical protein